MEWGSEAQMEEQHKDARCLINPGSKMKQVWFISGSLMSGEIVAVTVTERFLSFGGINDVKLQGVYRALNSLFAVQPQHQGAAQEPTQSQLDGQRAGEREEQLISDLNIGKAKISDLLRDPVSQEASQMSRVPI